MNSKSLRTKGPVGNDIGVNDGEDARNSTLTNAIATPHPDHCEPENKLTPEVPSAPPKGNLGHKGMGGL